MLNEEYIFIYVLAGAAFLQIFYYLFFFIRLAFIKKEESDSVKPDPVSVIIAARNEEDNLKTFLPKVLAQKGVRFEVIVINDCSVDDTEDIVRDFAKQYDNFSYSTVKENKSFEGGKKFAITMGIKKAQFDNLVFIDADCYPSSKHWLKNMALGLMKRNIVLGYGPYKKGKGLLNKLIRMDAFFIGLQYITFAKAGFPYMGVGRNMAYKSHLFFDNKGFASHRGLKSGDDDLFINEVANSKNTTTVLNKDSVTFSIPEKSVKDWVFQKRRHLTTAKKYRFLHKMILGLLSFSLFMFYGALIVTLIFTNWWQEALVIFGVRFLIQQIVFVLTLNKTREMDLLAVAVIFDIFYIIFYPALVLINLHEKSNSWKR